MALLVATVLGVFLTYQCATVLKRVWNRNKRHYYPLPPLTFIRSPFTVHDDYSVFNFITAKGMVTRDHWSIYGHRVRDFQFQSQNTYEDLVRALRKHESRSPTFMKSVNDTIFDKRSHQLLLNALKDHCVRGILIVLRSGNYDLLKSYIQHLESLYDYDTVYWLYDNLNFFVQRNHFSWVFMPQNRVHVFYPSIVADDNLAKYGEMLFGALKAQGSVVVCVVRSVHELPRKLRVPGKVFEQIVLL